MLAKGTAIYSVTSWGKRQIKDIFEYTLIKTHYNCTELARISWDIEADLVGFGNASNLVSILDTYFSQIPATLGYKSYQLCLKTLWEENVEMLQHNSAPEEFIFAKRLFNKLKTECAEGTIIGKKQIAKALYLHSLNLLDHI